MKRLIKRFAKDRRGAIAVWFALGVPTFIGLAALAIDLSYAMVQRNKLQFTASAAALAGAAVLPDENLARAEALDFVERNLPADGFGTILDGSDIEVGNWNHDTRNFAVNIEPYNAIRIVTRRLAENDNAVSAFFAGIAGLESFDVNTEAIAISGGDQQDACIVALESSETGLYLNGNNTLETFQCGVCVNSGGSDAVDSQGVPIVNTVEGVTSVHGQVTDSPNPHDPFTPPAQEGQSVCLDPFATAPLFETEFANDSCPGGADTSLVNGTVRIHPGVHCNDIKITGNRDAVFEPGIHHFISADFEVVGSNAEVTGENVTILLSDAELNMSGGKSIDLSAPADTGVVIYQNPATAEGTYEHDIGGNVEVTIDGIQYYGMQDVEYHGTTASGGGGSGCHVVIGRRITLKGTTDSDYAANCSDTDLIPQIGADLALRLVN